MDIEEIFNLFNVPEGEKDESIQMNLSEYPAVWMGMFKKLIINYQSFSQQLLKFFENSDPKLDTEDIHKAGCYMVFNRALENLSKIEVDNSFHIECLKFYADKDFRRALTLAIDYFISEEEYEKCSYLQKIQNTINLS
jgi:hypothetical protein